MIKTLKVHMGLFDFSVEFYVGDHEETIKHVAKKFHKEIDNDEISRGYIPRGQTLFAKGYCPVIWLPRRPKSAREHATLAHECIHAVGHLFDWVGIDMVPANEEVLAHSVAHLIYEFSTEKLNEVKPKVKT